MVVRWFGGGKGNRYPFKGTVVYCRFTGDCATCAGSTRTLKNLVESSLKGQVDESIRVVEV